MGTLTTYLQREFARLCPPGWSAKMEVPLLSRELEGLLGYAPRADVLLAREDGVRRLWIEFEVSRAGPVANHAKFATAHLFSPQVETDAFVAMVSPHVSRGRRNLASNAVSLMRQVGMEAFQTVLFPHLSPEEVKRLNHLRLADVRGLNGTDAEWPDVGREMERVFVVSEAALAVPGHRVYLASDLLDVMLNVRQWNVEMETKEGRALWGRRTVRYFVLDPRSGEFAPSKFCAYLPLRERREARGHADKGTARTTMTLELYAQLDGQDSRFDGHRARTHLERGLAMRRCAVEGVHGLGTVFEQWCRRYRDAVQGHPAGVVVLVPPEWYS
jgi:hypothetical protein